MSHTATETAETPGIAHTGHAATWRDRAGAADWDSVRADLDAYGCGLIGPLLNPDEAVEIAAWTTQAVSSCCTSSGPALSPAPQRP